MTMKKLLWPTDFSANAGAALPHVKSMSEYYDAEIHVFHVLQDVVHHEGWYGVFDPEHVERLMEKAKKQAEERLDQLCERHMEGCMRFVKHVAVGDPADEILKLVENEKIDMIVMARQGKSGNYNFGSVTQRVSNHSLVPVTIIPLEKLQEA